jgi:uncharacterized protein (TIGR02453 family)
MTAGVLTFSGFRPELLGYLAGLRENNSREWFAAHRDDYDQLLLEPAREFVIAMGERLPKLGQDIHAEPKIRGSIFALNRDVRFSADKSPYKSHLDLWFWQGDGPSRERPGYFLRLSPENLMLGAGMHTFSDTALRRFREAVLDPAKIAAFESAVSETGAEIGGQTYKRVPAGLAADPAAERWLRHTGLFAASEQPPPPELFTPAFPDFCLEQFRRVAPIQRWLAEVVGEPASG